MAYAQLQITLTPSPSGWTYGGLIQHFAERFNKSNDTDYKERIRGIIREVMLDIMGRYTFSWMKSSDTLVVQPGLGQYGLAADCAYMIGDFVIAGKGLIERRPLHILRRHQASSQQNTTPRMFSIVHENTVEFFPIPGSAENLLYSYILMQSDVIEDLDAPAMPRQDQHVLLSGIEYELRADDDRNDRALLRVESRFERGIQNMIWRDAITEKDQAIPDRTPPMPNDGMVYS